MHGHLNVILQEHNILIRFIFYMYLFIYLFMSSEHKVSAAQTVWIRVIACLKNL